MEVFTPLARRLAALSDAPLEEQGYYRPAPNGGYELHPEIAEIADRAEPALIASAALIADRDARIQESAARLASLQVSSAVGQAMRAAGVGLREWQRAARYFLARFNPTVQDGFDGAPTVSVRDEFGEVGLDFAVRAFLETEEGRIFRGEPRSHRAEEGPNAAALRQLRSRLQ